MQQVFNSALRVIYLKPKVCVPHARSGVKWRPGASAWPGLTTRPMINYRCALYLDYSDTAIRTNSSDGAPVLDFPHECAHLPLVRCSCGMIDPAAPSEPSTTCSTPAQITTIRSTGWSAPHMLRSWLLTGAAQPNQQRDECPHRRIPG